jgi:hypothetical protein
MKLLLSIFTAAAIGTAYGQGTFEAIQGFNNTSPSFWDGTAGGTFTVTNPVTVTALGAFDYLFGLNSGTIQVGLWDSTGALIASSMISSTNPPVNQSRYQPINPVVLNPNQTYSMGAFSTNGTIFLNIASPALGSSITNAPEIVLGNSARFEGGFAAPTAVTNTPGSLYLGANFEIQGAVPEPATGLLAGLAGLLLAAYRFCRARK